MPDQLSPALIQAAIERGFLAADAVLQPLALGNADRRASPRQSWVGRHPDGAALLLTTGSDLPRLARTQSAFSRDCPALVHAPLAWLSLSAGDLLIESFSADPPLANLPVDQPEIARRAAHAFSVACDALAATSEPSQEQARRAEWSSWCEHLVSISRWQPAETRLLSDQILPALYPLIASHPPATQWSNGDFTAANLLVSPTGHPRLIDLEYARRTHFPAEDAARFHALSPIARRHPHLFTTRLPRPGPAAQLHFWLRQMELEALHNSSAYLARIWSRRLRTVRRLAEQILNVSLDAWSTPPLELEAHLEIARWAGDGGPRLLLSGWCHQPNSTPGTAVVLHAGDRLLAEAPLRDRPDVARHFHNTPGSQQSGFVLEPRLPAPDLTLGISLLDAEGVLLPFATRRTVELPGYGAFLVNYAAWAERHDPEIVSADTSPPAAFGLLFSILVPVYRSDFTFLRACVESVRQQHYRTWELILIDDGSVDAELTRFLDSFGRSDRRIRILHRSANQGIARTTNEALAAAQGEYIVLLDHDDVLRPHALAIFAARIAGDPALDALYSDEEKISPTGERLVPFLKPAFSPEFLRGVMYPGHALCVRRSIAQAAGGFNPDYDGIQDYEFFLRVAERGARIAHVPRILYQWRQSPTSSALHGNVKGDMDRKQAEAVQAHLHRIGDNRRAVALGGHRVRLEATTQPSVELVSLAHGDSPLRALASAARSSSADVLVLTHPGGATPTPAGLAELCALAARPDSGCVGPMLVSPQDRVIASGLTVHEGRLIPLMAGFDAEGDGYNGSLRCNREVLAVPPAGVAVRRNLILQTGSSSQNWFEFCEAVSAAGFFHRVCASARLVMDPADAGLEAHPAPQAADAYYNPHFDRAAGNYALASPPPHFPPPARQSLFHLDEAPDTFVPHGCVSLRGWCFRRDGRAVTLRAASGRESWIAACNQSRPDVAAAHADGLTDGQCGFVLHFLLSAGVHQISLEAEVESGDAEHLATLRVAVPPTAFLGRAFLADPRTLLAHQFPAWRTHAPRRLRPESFPPPTSLPEHRPAIAVVTPSFQQAAYLEETLRSVLHDPGLRLAYVVQDGGSTDGSVDIIRRQASRLHRWASAPDRGQADAIAQGFAQTSGQPEDIMAWINSDDFYLPGTLSFVIDWFARHPDVDVIYGHRILVDENSHEVGRWFLPPHDPAVLRLNDFVPQETLFWRRRLWDRVGGVDPTLRFALDWDLLLRFQAAGARIVRVPRFLACFRIHAAQKTSAQIHSVGRREIERLRTRTNNRSLSPAELESHPSLTRYLRRSALLGFLWNMGVRAP